MNYREESPPRAPFDDRAILGPSADAVVDSSQWTNLTREDAMACVMTIERDLEDIEGQRDARLRDSTSEAIAEARREARAMRRQLDDLSGQAPDAWGEMQDAVGAALKNLETSFQRVLAKR